MLQDTFSLPEIQRYIQEANIWGISGIAITFFPFALHLPQLCELVPGPEMLSGVGTPQSSLCRSGLDTTLKVREKACKKSQTPHLQEALQKYQTRLDTTLRSRSHLQSLSGPQLFEMQLLHLLVLLSLPEPH